MEKLLLRPDEAADALGVSRSKVYELLAEGVIPTVKIGEVRRVPVEGIRRWVANQMALPKAEENSSDGA